MKRVVFWLLFVSMAVFGSISLKKEGVYGGELNDMKVSGEFLYTASQQGIGVLSLSDPLNIREVSFLSALGANVLYVDREFGRLFAGFKDGRVEIYSLSNPFSLRRVAKYKESGCEINDIKIKDGYAYLACGEKGISVLDISNKDYIFKVSSLDTPGFAKKLILRGNIAFLMDRGFGVDVINISNPSSLFFEKRFHITPKPTDMALKDKYLYITNGSHGLLVMNVENPKALDWDKQDKFIRTDSYFSKIKIFGDNLFVIEGGKLKGMSILDPLNPLVLFEYETIGDIEDFAVFGDKLFLRVDSAGIETVDISNLSKPSYKARYIGENFYASVMTARGKYAYIADKYFGVHIVDISDPSDIRSISFIKTDSSVSDIYLRGRYAFLALKNGKILIEDILNPFAPKKVTVIDSDFSLERIYVENDRLYVAGGKDGISIYNIKDIKNPTKEGEFFTGGYAYNLRVKGDYIYVADGKRGISIVDVSYPALPFLEGRIGVGKRVFDLRIRDSFLYAACEKCLKIYDISNVKLPLLKATYLVKGDLFSIDLRGKHALLGIRDKGVEIVNIGDFSNIYLEAFENISSFTDRVMFNYDEVLTASGDSGFRIYKIFSHAIKPTNVYAFALGKDKAYIFWDRVKDDINGYYLTRVEADTQKRVVVGLLDRYTEDFEDFGLLPNTRYYYELQASTDFGLSDVGRSNVILTEGGNPPLAPSDLKAVLAADKSIVLSWKDNSDNENAFYVRRYEGKESKIVAILPPNSTVFKDKDIKEGKEYKYEVWASNEFGDSAAVSSPLVKVSQIAPPKAPANFKASLKDKNEVLLTWEDRSDNEEAFAITRRNPDGSFVKVASLPADSESYVDSNLSMTGVYQYYIVAVNKAGVSKKVISNSVEIKGEFGGVPKAPSDFKAKVIDDSRVKLTWKDNSDNENGFYIVRNNPDGTMSVVAFVDKDEEEFVDEDVKKGGVYTYQILAINDEGVSDWVTSNEVKIEGQGIPKAPSMAYAKVLDSDSIKITWQDNSDNELGFYLEREEDGKDPIIIAILDPDTAEFIDKGVKKGVKYRYYVSAFNDSGTSAKSRSNEVVIKEEK